MKRESVNTFSGGLTYDINPITTPNNVLTDGVNATFLTFNGDEMALQNDAGNTTIISSYGEANKETYNPENIYYKYALVVYGDKLYYCKKNGVTGEFDASKWTIVTDSVKLSDGFKPIGLKEHGGILYIVSHKKTGSSDEFEIGSYPSPGHKKKDIAIDTTPIEVVKVDGITNRLGEFIQLSNSELFPGDPYRITFSTEADLPDNLTIENILTIGDTRKFYTFKFYLKPKEGDFIALEDIEPTKNLTPFYSDGLAFVPNKGSGTLFIKFELEDIDEFTQYSQIDGDKYYFPRLSFADEGTFIEFDYFDVKHDSNIKLDAIEMKYTLINSQTGAAAEEVIKELPELPDIPANIPAEGGEFDCKYDNKNFFRVQTPNTAQILEYTFTPKNIFYDILFNNHIIKNSIDLSIDPLLWGNRLTYSEEEKGNFYFQSPDSGDWPIFKNKNPYRGVLKIDWGASFTYGDDVSGKWTVNLNNYNHFSYIFNNVAVNFIYYSGSSQKINYTQPFDYKKFSTINNVHRNFWIHFDYRRAAFENDYINKYELVDEGGEWVVPTWWTSTIGGGFDTEEYGADRAIFLDNNNKIVATRTRILPGGEWGNIPVNYRYGYYLSRAITTEGVKLLKVNGAEVKSEPVKSPGKFSYSQSYTSGESALIDSIEMEHYSSTGASPAESYIGSFHLTEYYVSLNNKGREITLMKKATDNFDGVFKATTYDFKEAILNNSKNLIEPLTLTTRQSNIVSGGRAQVRYVLNNGSTTKAITNLTEGQKYTLAFYLIAEGPSSINVKILGNEYTINYTSDGATLQATVEGSPYKQTHNHDEVNGLYINKIPTLYNGRYYSYVKYTFDYTSSGNLVISTTDTFEIAELTLKIGIIIPQAVRVYQDMLYGKIDDSLKPYMYNLPDIDNNVLGKLYIPNTNYEIRGVLPYGL